MNKLIAIGGQTASGKTDLAIQIAQKFNGEVINSDSRQFYRSMNIGTGKGTISKYNDDGTVIIENIRHYLIDIFDPNEEFNLYKFKKEATASIDKIVSQGKLPIIVGGTGLYLDSVIYNYNLSKSDPDLENRSLYKKMSVSKLQELLGDSIDQLNNSDRNNPHRLIRLLEKKSLGISNQKKRNPLYQCLYLCIDINTDTLKENINNRVEKMFENGLLEENKKLRESGYTQNLNAMKSIGYQEFNKYFEGSQTIDETKELIKLHTRQYAKRQMTWFKRNKDVHWIENFDQASSLIKKFL